MKRLFPALIALVLILTLCTAMLPAAFAEEENPSMEKAMAWAVETADDPACGYSKTNRFGPDYDCSSFVSAALMAGGFDLGGYLTTAYLPEALTELGFVRLRRSSTVLLPGDILFSPGTHVEIYLGDGKCVGAHQDYDYRSGDSKDKEIQVRDESQCPFCRYGQYKWVYRYMPDRPANYDAQPGVHRQASSISINK